MKNPYEILKVSQNANKTEIMKAQMTAMKEKAYSLQEIQVAARQLLDPAKRLAADFMFPAKIKSKRPQVVQVDVKVDTIDLNSFKENDLNSL
ncbi:MAG: molecular chaperone DnaJ [Bacteroidia bacterium]